MDAGLTLVLPIGYAPATLQQMSSPVLTRCAWLLLAALLAAAVPAAPAAAATTFGSSLDGAPDDEEVSCPVITCVAVFAPPAGVAAAAPVDGVLTRWIVRSATAGEVWGRLVRGDDPFTPGAEIGHAEVAPGFTTVPARVAVRAGDRLAVYGEDLPGIFTTPGTGSTPVIALDRRWYFGEEEEATADIDGELLVQGVIEPDADGDGYGDETQDVCPGSSDPRPCTAVSITGSGPVLLPPGGGRVTQVFTVRNDGPQPAAPVQLQADTGTRWGRSSPPEFAGCTPTPAGAALSVCTIATLAPGQTHVVTVTYPSTSRSVTTRLRVMPWGSWVNVVRPAVASVQTEVASLSNLRPDVGPHDDVMSTRSAFVDIACPLTDLGPCRIDLMLRTRWRPRGRGGLVTLFRRSVQVAPGDQRTVRLRLSKRAMRVVRSRRGSAAVKLTATRSFASSQTVTGSASFRLKPPRASKRR